MHRPSCLWLHFLPYITSGDVLTVKQLRYIDNIIVLARFLKFREVAMQLVINTYGAYLKKSGECFVIKNEDKVFEVSPRKVESIMITTSAYLSTDATGRA